MATRKHETQLMAKDSPISVASLPPRIAPVHVHVDDATTVLVHIKRLKDKKNEDKTKSEISTEKPSRLPLAIKSNNCVSPVPLKKSRKRVESEPERDVNPNNVSQNLKNKHEISGACSNTSKISEPNQYCKKNTMSDEERAFFSRTFNILQRAQCDWGQERSTAGKDPSLVRVEKEIDKVDDGLSQVEGEMKQLQHDNVAGGSNDPCSAEKRQSLINKLNELECTQSNIKNRLMIPDFNTRDNALIEKAEYVECRNREYECKIRDQDVIIGRLQRQVQCEKDYVSSLCRMQGEMEEIRGCLQQELLSKSQEAEKSVMQMKNLQNQMGGHISEVERLQDYVDQTIRKCEGDKMGLKKAIRGVQERLVRAEDALQKGVIRIECMELENSKLLTDMKHIGKEIEYLKPLADGKQQLEEVCDKLQAQQRDLQPLPDIIKTKEQKLLEEQKRRVQSEQRIGEQTRLIHELTTRIDAQISTMTCMECKVDQINAENLSLRSLIDDLNKEVFQNETTISELNSALHLKNEQINEMNLKLGEKDGATQEINQRLEEALAESTRLSCLVEERTQLLETQNKARIKELQEQLTSTKHDIKQLKAEKHDLECKYGIQMNDLRDKLAQCDTATHTMQSYIAYLKTSYANVLNDPNLTAMCNHAAAGPTTGPGTGN